MSFIHDIYLKIKILFRSERKEIWLVKNTLDGELCTVKLQFANNESKKNNVRTVLHQGKFLQMMQGHLGIPFMFWAGRQEGTGTGMLIMERLGMTVERLFKENGQPFTLKTVCQLGINLFKMIFSYHDKGFTHGNLQISSIQFGVGKKCNQLYFNDLIDSGSFIKKGKHIKQKQYIKRGKINQFMSLDRLQGFEGSRRDDIESIIYILIFLLKGSLPWTKYFEKTIFKRGPTVFEECEITLKDESMSKEETNEQTIKFNHSRTKQISDNLYNQSLCRLQMKVQQATIDQICEGTNIEFKKMLTACKGIEFEERPVYNDFIRSLEKILEKKGLENNEIYDWMMKTDKRLILKKEEYKNFGLTLSNEQEILDNWYYPFEGKIELS